MPQSESHAKDGEGFENMLRYRIILLVTLLSIVSMAGPAQAAETLVINEFMASNSSFLDEDGDSSDWIEVFNQTEQAVSLDGWYLTDDPNNMKKWEFPAVEIQSGGFVVVFASGKNRRDPDGELHTNFQLKSGGEFLALVRPDGQTIEHSYNQYPRQFVDISYGLGGGTGSTTTQTILIPEYTAAKALIPTDGSLGLSWTQVGFNDSAWLSGTTGVGYDYAGLIGLDVGAMRYVNPSVYARIPFIVDDVSAIDRLTLWMKYEDGFVAYINGVPVADSGADDPENMSWNEGSTGNRDDSLAQVFEDFDITNHIGTLHTGNNILAIHGLNQSISSSDLLVLPELAAVGIETIDVPSRSEGYLFEPTPGRENSGIRGNIGPAIRHVTDNLPQPSPGQDMVITAEVEQTADPVGAVELFWYINFDQRNRWLPEGEGMLMADDGTGADAVAGDGIYTAVIGSEAFNPGDMVRWYVTAGDIKGVASRAPQFLLPKDSPEYYGTVMKDSSINTQLPVIEWFVENVAASETDGGTRGSVYFLGQFYDNILIHRRGGSTAGAPKKHFKFNFNHGYKFQYDPNLPRVNEFNLNSTYSDKAYLRQNLAFEAYDWCGCPGSVSFPVRAQRNGEFYGVQIFIEEPEEELLEREGLDPDGALYKMYNMFENGGSAEKKTRRWENRSDLDDFTRSINNYSGVTRHNNIFDRVNLPLTLDYLVATIITHQNDHPHKNHYLYRDSDGSGEWCFLPWDHDLTWGSNWTGSSYHDYIYADDDQVPGKPTDVKPSHPFVGKQDCQEWNYHWNHLIDALLNDATVREMYLRRLRTVMDELLKPPGTPYNELFIENRIDELFAQMAPDVALDYAKWANPWTWGGQGGYPADQSPEYAIDVIKNDYLAVRRHHLFVTHNVDNAQNYNIPGSYSALIPNAQPDNPVINFGSIDYSPASGNQDEEYIQLLNPNSYAVDISGWKLTGGVEHTFLPGTVIVAGGSLYVTPNPAAFRARSTSPRGGQGLFVQGNYKGHLSSWGETLNLLTDNNYLIDSMTYAGNPSDQQRYLRITELMYHPADSSIDDSIDNGEYEFIELKNIGNKTLDLSSVAFVEGITFNFGEGSLTSLGAGEFVLVVANQAAFESRYGTGLSGKIAGQYSGRLSNSGEKIKLEDAANQTILDFHYDDSWYQATDGMGFSLTIIDPANADLNSWDEKDSWLASTDVGGSPGRDDIGDL
jgi:hypothetical protein